MPKTGLKEHMDYLYMHIKAYYSVISLSFFLFERVYALHRTLSMSTENGCHSA